MSVESTTSTSSGGTRPLFIFLTVMFMMAERNEGCVLILNKLRVCNWTSGTHCSCQNRVFLSGVTVRSGMDPAEKQTDSMVLIYKVHLWISEKACWRKHYLHFITQCSVERGINVYFKHSFQAFTHLFSQNSHLTLCVTDQETDKIPLVQFKSKSVCAGKICRKDEFHLIPPINFLNIPHRRVHVEIFKTLVPEEIFLMSIPFWFFSFNIFAFHLNTKPPKTCSGSKQWEKWDSSLTVVV